MNGSLIDGVPMMNSDVHSLRWWSVKVVVGFLLVARVLERQFVEVLPTYALPTVRAGQLAVGVGAAVVLWHYVLLKRRFTDLSTPERLLTDAGFFRIIRHPMYLGDLIMYAGLTGLAPGVISLFLLALGSYAIYRQALVEDRHMKEQFGSEFERWRERTGLLLPVPGW